MSSKPAPVSQDGLAGLAPVGPESLEKMEKAERAQTAANRVPGNSLLAFTEAAPGELDELRAARVLAVARLREINTRIADLETHALVAGVEITPAAQLDLVK